MEVVYECVDVVGIKYHREELHAFTEAYNNGMPSGVRLEPEPDNWHDKNAIKVMGFWSGREEEERHVGYLSAALADLIAYRNLRGLQAEVDRCDAPYGTEDFVLQLRILAPPS